MHQPQLVGGGVPLQRPEEGQAPEQRVGAGGAQAQQRTGVAQGVDGVVGREDARRVGERLRRHRAAVGVAPQGVARQREDSALGAHIYVLPGIRPSGAGHGRQCLYPGAEAGGGDGRQGVAGLGGDEPGAAGDVQEGAVAEHHVGLARQGRLRRQLVEGLALGTPELQLPGGEGRGERQAPRPGAEPSFHLAPGMGGHVHRHGSVGDGVGDAALAGRQGTALRLGVQLHAAEDVVPQGLLQGAERHLYPVGLESESAAGDAGAVAVGVEGDGQEEAVVALPVGAGDAHGLGDAEHGAVPQAGHDAHGGGLEQVPGAGGGVDGVGPCAPDGLGGAPPGLVGDGGAQVGGLDAPLGGGDGE